MMTLKSLLKLSTISTLTLVLTLTASLARADNPDSSGIEHELKQSNSYWNNLPQLIQPTLTAILNNTTSLMFEKIPDIGKTIATFSSVGPLLAAQHKATAENTKKFTDVFVGVNPKNESPYSANDNYLAVKQRYDAFNSSGTLSATNLLGPEKYSAPEETAAKNYAGYLSGAALSIGQPQAILEAANPTPAEFEKANNDKTIAAIQSLNNYNLSKLYASRLPISTNNLTSLNNINTGGTISSQQLFQYLAMHKATSADWYEKMQTASPFTVTRELLNFSAGIFMELHQMEQNQEQILATLSAQNTLMIMMEQQLQKQENH